MHISSDADVVAAVPVLKPLLTLASLSPTSWKHLSSHDGYSVSELPPTPAEGLPIKSYRTHFVVNAGLNSFHRMLSDEASVRQFDPTLRDMEIIERRAPNTLLYTSYVSPSPWIVAPRDFCVWSATIFTTLEQLKRVCSKTKESAVGSSNVFVAVEKFFSTSQQFGEPPDPTQTLYLQNSVTALESDAAAVRTTQSGKPFVRGVVYCFGYVAFADPSIQGNLRVTHYCCVDPNGQIPKWLVATAMKENTKKLKRMAELVKDVAAAAVPTAEPASACLNTFSAESLSAEEPQTLDLSPRDSAQEPSQDANDESVATALLTRPSCADAPLSSVPTAGASVDGDACPSLDESPSTVSVIAVESADVSSSPQHIPKEERGASLPLAMARNTVTHDFSLTSTSPQYPNTDVSVDPRVEILSLLARSSGWITRREVGEMQYAELRVLPGPLRSKDPLCFAMRVSTSFRCTLDTFAAVLHNRAFLPEIDPELVRVVACMTPSSASSRTASREPSTSPHNAAPTAGELRHYQFDAHGSFRSPWDMVLQCTDFELTQFDGGRYGFHTPGVPAATHVWLGADRATDCCSGLYPNGYHQRMQVRVFGVTAVAIPRRAESIRVSQYMLFDARAPLLHNALSTWHISSLKKCPTEEFLSGVSKWMESRMERLCRLSEEQQRRRDSIAMVELDKSPLLRFLYRIHCAEGIRALQGPEAIWYGDVLARAIRWTGEGGSRTPPTEAASDEPPLLVLSALFPCSLAKLRDYMLLNLPRHRYALENGVCTYEELTSPPDFTTVRVEYGPASASFPWVRLTVLEAFGELNGVNGPWPTLVLSRTGLEGNVDDECLGMDSNIDDSHHPRLGVDERFADGRVFCSGWVATALQDSGNQSCANSLWAALRSPHNGLVPISPGLCTEHSTSDSKAEECAVNETQRIVVTQYLSVGLPSSHRRNLDADGLPCGCIAEQASLLQRFRDSVCMWRASITATSSE